MTITPIYLSAPPAASQQAASAAPSPPSPQPTDPADPTPLDRMLDSATVSTILKRGLKPGDVVTIESDGKVILQLKRQDVSGYERFKTFAADAFRVTSAEASNIVSQDPAFAFKVSAVAVQSQVYAGVPDAFSSIAQQGFLPMIRVISLALDGKKAVETFRSSSATGVDKVIDGGHVLSDIVGLGGALATVFPSIGPTVSLGLTLAGLLGDVAAYGYHVVKYLQDRGKKPPPPPAS